MFFGVHIYICTTTINTPSLKKITLLLSSFLLAIGAHAQLSDSLMKPLMQHRMYSCNEVEYNAVLLAQKLYKQNETGDSLTALVTFCKKHCDISERVFSLSVLDAIRTNRFKESMKASEFLLSRDMTSFDAGDMYDSYVLQYLDEYKRSCDGVLAKEHFQEWQEWNYPLPRNNEEYYEFYKTYYAFLQRMAQSMIGKRKYTPVEDFLLHFYASPDSVRFSSLDSNIYDSSVLKSKYVAYRKFNKEVSGFSSTLHMGMWIPNGSLSLLGSQPYFTYGLGARSETFMWEATIGIRPGSSATPYLVERYDSIYTSTNFFSWNTGFDMGIKLFRKKKHELDVLFGTGYEELQVLSIYYSDAGVSTSTNSIAKSINSFNANAGLGYKLFITNKVTKNNNHLRRYVSFQAKYNYVNYKNIGGTDLTGNYVTIGLAYGIYSRPYKRYKLVD